MIEPWLRELGFSIFYGSILIKLYRILTEFQTRKAHRVCFRDKDQIVYLLAIVLIVVGYMSAWTALMVDGFFFGHNNQQRTTITSSSNHLDDFNQKVHLEQIDRNNMEERYSLLTSGQTEKLLNDNALLDYQENRVKRNINRTIFETMPISNLQVNYSILKRQMDTTTNEEKTLLRNPPNLAFNVKRKSPIERDDNIADNLSLYEIIDKTTTKSANLLDASLAVEQLPERLRTLVISLNSFSDLFSGLLETSEEYLESNDSLAYSFRCRKLTWDYVTELSK